MRLRLTLVAACANGRCRRRDESRRGSLRGCATLLAALAILGASGAAAETRPLTLQQAVELALRQNPDYLLARLDEEKARHAAREARSPFIPRLTVGSGLAYSSGFPLSIEGSAPSIVQAQGAQYIFNRPQSWRVREAGAMADAAAHATGAKGDEIAFRIAAAYLDFERASRAAGSAARLLDSRVRVEQLVEERVRAGRDIPLESTRARVETARARAQLQELEAHRDLLEATLRGHLALGDDVRLAPAETRVAWEVALPENEEAAVAAALASSGEIKRLEAQQQARRYQVKAERSALLPRVDLVAQYAVLGRFNNYEDFFRTFRRHNGQIGMSFQVPLFANRQISSRVAQVEAEISQASLRLAAARAATALEARRLFREVRQGESGRELARLELDLARESLSVSLARFDEGRVSLREVELARVEEFRRWEAFYDAQTAAGKSRLDLLRRTGTLLAALR